MKMLGRWVSSMTWLIVIPAMTALGQQVHFDVVPEVACRDVTPPDFASLNPDERMLEAHLQISSLVTHGTEKQLDQYLLRIESVSGSTTFVDFAPKTAVSSSVVGNMTVEDVQEKSAGAKLSANADFKGLAHLDLGSQEDSRRSAHYRYEMLPPHELVTASGTTRGGRGVYFKLRPTTQGTLEGARDLQVILRVPQNWRGERLFVYCYAWPLAKSHSTEPTSLPSNRAVFSVVLYGAGDAVAKQVARNFLAAEQQVREVAWDHVRQREQHHNQWKTVWNQIRGDQQSQLPADWLQQVTMQPQEAARSDYFERLPTSVRSAVQHYAAVKESFGALSQSPPSTATAANQWRGM